MAARLGITAAKNAIFNLLRLAVSALATLVVPPLLVHHLSPQSYGAWVLVLQVSAYVNLLDFGIQTAISKFIAEYHAVDDLDACRRVASTSFFLLMIAAGIGILFSLGLAWQLPRLFHQMPAQLLFSTRIAVVMIGCSLALGLPAATCSAIFFGLQRNKEPVLITSLGKALSAAALVLTAAAGYGMVAMAAVVAAVNLLTCLSLALVWRALLPQFAIRTSLIDRPVLRRILAFSAMLTSWSIGLLLISGLDLTIVGHYSFNNTAYYAMAVSLTSLVIVTHSAVFSPLLPAASSLNTRDDPSAMGNLLLRTTKYGTMLLLATGLPLLLFAYPILTLWVGHAYAAKSALLLRVLVVANMIRLVGLPYTTIVSATGRLKLATFGTLAEAIVNLACSILLARHFGAVGVALGTLIGAVLNIAVHLLYSMRHTAVLLAVKRRTLLTQAVLVPLLCAVPAVALTLPHHASRSSQIAVPVLGALLSLAAFWEFGLNRSERISLSRVARRPAGVRAGY